MIVKLLSIVFAFCFSFLCYAQPTNLDFSSGNLNGWNYSEAQNSDSYLMINSVYSNSSQYALMLPGVLELNNVPVTMFSPLGGKFMRIGNTSKGGRSYKLSQTFNVGSTSHALSISYALVASNENNYCNDKPYFNFVLKDSIGNIIPSANIHYVFYGQAFQNTKCPGGDQSFQYSGNYKFKNWVTNSFSLQDYIGTNVTIEFIASGSTDSLSTDVLYAYVDAAICNNSFTSQILSVNTNTYSLLNSQNSILVCGTTSASVVAPSGASSYSWTGSGINGVVSQSVNINQPGSYKLFFNNPSACSNSTSVSFTIAGNPTISFSSITNTTCAGDATTITATGAKSYTWAPYFNDSTGTNTYFKPSHVVFPNTSSTYTVYGTDSTGCKSQAQFSLVVIPKTVLSVSGSTSVCFGVPSSLIASGANSYTWSPGDIFSATLTMTPTYNTTYTVSGMDAATGCITNKVVDVFVDRNIEDSYLSKSICIGDSISLIATGATSYTWSNGVTTNSVILKPASTTSYTLSATAGSCGFVQKTFTISVNQLPSIVANATQTFVCKGSSIKLYGSGGQSYIWSNGISNNVLFTPTVTNTYSVIGTNFNGCKNTAAVTISVVPIPTISAISSSTFMCLGQTATLTASGANTYTWTNGLTTPTITWSPTSSGLYNYFVNGKNSFGCSSTAYISITVYSASPIFTFPSPTATVCATNTSTISIPPQSSFPYDVYSCGQPNTSCDVNGLVLNPTPLTPTIYSVTATNACGSVTQTIQVIPQALPNLILNAPDSVCSGNIFSYSVSGADLYYDFNNSNGVFSAINTFTANANYPSQIYITGKYYNGCMNQIVKYINVIPNPTITVSGNGTLTCSSCTTSLLASGASTYSWSTGELSSLINVSPTSTTEYSVTGKAVNGCVAHAKTQIIVMDSLTMCFRTSLRLTGASVKDIVTADFNGDGLLDIVSSNSGILGLSVYLNNGTGGFLPPINFGHYVGDYGLTVSDINNDSFLDIIITESSNSISVYINDGSANFIGPNNYQQPSSLSFPYMIFCLTTADLTGDGFDEIITGNLNGIIVHKNSGYGTFNSIPTGFMCGFILSIHSADLNNDSRADIVAFSESDTAYVFINNGSGGFLPFQKYLLGNRGLICDINADGKLDLVGFKKNLISMLINNGSGIFNLSTNQPSDVSAFNLVSEDFNTDGFPDLAVAEVDNISYVPYFKIFINMKNNTFHSPVKYYPSANQISLGLNIRAGDMDNDSRRDIIVFNSLGDSIFVSSNYATPSLTVIPNTNNIICAGSSYSLSAIGATTYSWSGNISNGSIFNPTNTQTYTLNATDVIGCNGYAVATVSVSPDLKVESIGSFACVGANATITASGAETYSWSTGVITNSISVLPTTASSTVYSVVGTDLSTGCSYTQTLSLITDSCESVWPGDVNNDNIADNIDVLELGLHFNQIGSARNVISNSWQEYPSLAWNGIISNGNNLCHSDCNGDGIVNISDTLAIFNNYSLVHAKSNILSDVNPLIKIIPEQTSIIGGNWGSASIYLGDSVNLINNINGIAFTIDFDNSLIESGNIYIEYQNSFIDSGQNLRFRKIDFANGKLYTATTHTNNNNVNGFGKIATLHYKIKSTLTVNQVLNLGIFQGVKCDNNGLITILPVGSGTLMAISANVGSNPENIGKFFSITPNPAIDVLSINSSDAVQSISIISLSGQVLLSEMINSKTYLLQIRDIEAGIYLVKITYPDGISVIKKVAIAN